MRPNFGTIPPQIKGCQHLMKLAEDHDDRNIVISYYSRMATVQLAIKCMPGTKPPDIAEYLMKVMDWLEMVKKEYAAVEGITNETVAQALIEEYMIKIYNFAYDCDRTADFNRNMVKAYYTTNLLCEVLRQFGPLSEDIKYKGSISKRRAAYIHNILKDGGTPTPINVTVVHSEEEESEYILTLEELNKRRVARGDPPLPEDDEERRKMLEAENKLPENDAPQEPTSTQSVDEPEPEAPEPTSTTDTYPEPAPRQFPSPTQSDTVTTGLMESTAVANLEPSQSEKAMKYCKWASSALNYDDIKTAIANLEKALFLCKYGREKE